MMKKIFPLYFKLRQSYIDQENLKLTEDETFDLAIIYIVGKSVLPIVGITAFIYNIMKYILS